MVAQLLNLPHVGVVVKLELKDGMLVAYREIEGATEIIESSLPAVVTAQKGLNEPRYASLKGIMMAKKKEITINEASEAGLSSAEMGEEGAKMKVEEIGLPPERAAGKIIEGEPAEAAQKLAQLLRQEAHII